MSFLLKGNRLVLINFNEISSDLSDVSAIYIFTMYYIDITKIRNTNHLIHKGSSIFDNIFNYVYWNNTTKMKTNQTKIEK